MVYYGKWSVFNDPKFDQRSIPEDEKEKEALRIGLLLTYWVPLKRGNFTGIGGKLNVEKLVTYYHTEHTNHSIPLRICYPVQYSGLPSFYFCEDFSEESIKQYDSRGTFQYIWRYRREEFIFNIVVLPIISLIGVFGKAPF